MATFENCNSPSILTLVRVKPRHKIYAWEERGGNSNKESWDSMSDRFKSKCSIVRTVIPVILNHFVISNPARYRLSVFLHWINL